MAGFKQCNACGKGVQVGHNVSHAKNRTRKVWQPNLHSKRIWNGENYIKLRLCVKCIRLFNKAGWLCISCVNCKNIGRNVAYKEIDSGF